jgi:hypothetical protein
MVAQVRAKPQAVDEDDEEEKKSKSTVSAKAIK